MSVRDIDGLLRCAREGSSDALNALLAAYRPQLRRLARARLRERLGPRLDASDLVQQTLLEAARAFPQLRAKRRGELEAWLRRLLDHTLIGAYRAHALAEGRALGRERPLSASLGDRIAAEHTSPSQRLARAEERERLLAALAALPPDQREAVRLRHLEGLSLQDIAHRLGRSELATASLIKRGVRALRRELDRDDGTG